MMWIARTAMLNMWREMDTNVETGELMRFFSRHLQQAFDAGREQAAKDLTDAGLPDVADLVRKIAQRSR